MALSPVRAFRHPKFQLWLNLIMFGSAVALIPIAMVAHLLESVAFVAWLSLLALVFSGLGGVAAALVFVDAKSGMTLNQADRDWIRATVSGEVDEAVDELEEAARADEL